MNKKTIKYFILIAVGITVGNLVLIYYIAQRNQIQMRDILGQYDYLQFFGLVLLTAGASIILEKIIFYSKKELGIGQTLLRNVLHLCAVIGVSLLYFWIVTEPGTMRPRVILTLSSQIAIVYGFVWGVLIINDIITARKINKKIKQRREKEEKEA